MGNTPTPRHDEVDAIVAGAGFGGMYALHRLREQGLSVIGFDAAPEVGGTWYWNRYPGARCDIPSVLYSYHWSPEIRAEWPWSEMFAGAPEILEYAKFVADRLDLRPLIRFNTRIAEATFDEETNRWTVRTDDGDTVTAKYAVFALGNLSAPNLPDIPGIGSFTGRILHTAQWPEQDVDFTGLRVGVIGTGSSGVQVIPKIAETAEQLTVFQRTPAFTLPARNKPLDDETRGFLEQAIPFQAALVDRGRIPAEARDYPVPPREEQWQKYEELWNTSGAMFIAGGYPNVMVNSEVNDTVSDFIRGKIRETVTDPAVADALCPNYAYGAKRATLGTDYYETYNKPNVNLVSLRQDPIIEVTADVVVTESGSHPIDVLVLATGFDAVTGALAKVDIRGVGGRSLAEAWADGPKTYLGVATAGFPNLFLPTAPGGVAVIGNVLLNNEHNVQWISDAIAHVESTGAQRIEADDDAQADWMAHIAEMASDTLFQTADSWYVGANVPGKARGFNFYIGPGYITRCSEVAANGYPGFTLA